MVLSLVFASAAQGAIANGWLIWPDPPAGSGTSISALSTSDVWTVGTTGNGEISHWNGTSWDPSVQAPTGGYHTQVYGIGAVSASNVWAVGFQYTIGDDTEEALIDHYNGTSWSNTALPDFGSNEIVFDVDGSSASNVWAVGRRYNAAANGGNGAYQTLPLHYNGSSWSLQAGVNTDALTEFTAVSTRSSTDAWAVGVGGAGPGPLVEHWNGSSWSVSPTTNLSHANLNDVYEVSATNVWAVGSDGNQGVLIHWNGSSWSQVAVPGLASGVSSDLTAVNGSSDADIWIGGWKEGSERTSTFAAHYDGANWHFVSTPNPGGLSSSARIRSLSVASPTVAYATGALNGSTFLLRYGSGDFSSHFAFFEGQAAPLGSPVHLNGQLQFSEDANAWGATIHITRTSPDATEIDLPDVQANDQGAFAFDDTPPVRGTYTYTATYDGDASRSGVTTSTQVGVTGTATTLTLTPSARTIKYKGTLTLTAHLDGPAGATVKIMKTGATGTTSLLASGAVDGDGELVATTMLQKDATFQAVYDGDTTHEPDTSAKVAIEVRVAITGTLSGFYGRSGSYRLYHYHAACASQPRYCPKYTVSVKPNKAGRNVALILQIHTRRGWVSGGHAPIRLSRLSKASIRIGYTNTGIIGRLIRVRASYPRDTQNEANTSSWSYLKITR